jgi:hypothetical protein
MKKRQNVILLLGWRDQEPLGWSCVESGKCGTWRAV